MPGFLWQGDASDMAGPSTPQKSPPGKIRTFEMAVAIAVMLLSSLHIALYLGQMMHASLWTDELGAVKDFFEPGPWNAMTSYPIPRNHVFFSLLNSLLPNAGSLNPLRAQFLSYLFVGFLGASILWLSFRRGQYIEGAVVFALWGFNGSLIQLSLQARGYGLTCLFAFWSALLARRYAAHKSPRDFILLTICSVLGAYTIPTYAFFGWPLLLALAVMQRDKKAFAIAAGGAALLALLYAPIASQLIHAASVYKEMYGEYYASWTCVLKTLRAFLWPVPEWMTALLFIALCALSLYAWPKEHPTGRAARALLIAVVAFLAACLVMRTPPIRTTCFVALPLAWCCGELAGHYYRMLSATRMKAVACAALLTGAFAAETYLAGNFHFVPYENWALVWRFTETMFPRGTLVDCSRGANGLTYYMDQDHYRLNLTQPFNKPAFEQGRSLLVVAPWKNEEDRYSATTLSPQAIAATAPGFIRDISTWFVIPPQTHVLDAKWHQADTATFMEVRPDGAAPLHSLNICFEHLPADTQIHVAKKWSDHAEEIERSSIIQIGNVVTIPLDDTTPQSIRVWIGATVHPVNVWANPAK